LLQLRVLAHEILNHPRLKLEMGGMKRKETSLLGGDITWADGVDTNSLATKLARQGPSHLDDGSLTGVIGDPA
jgi:hypothetical protein